MSNTERNDTDGHALINSALNTAMKELQFNSDKGKDIPMSDFVKILLWAKNENSKLFAKEEETDKLHGIKFEDRKWCGEPVV